MNQVFNIQFGNALPSLVNCQKKRNWTSAKTNAHLTSSLLAAILFPLSQKTKAWSRNQSNGHNRPLYTVVFLCPPKTQAILCRVLSITAGLFGQRSALAGTVTGFRPHLSPPPDTVENIGGGYSLHNGVRAMSQNKSAQNSEQATLKTTNTEYTHSLTEAQTRLKALNTSFALFIGEDYEPDILGYQCVIDDADRLAGTVRHLYHLAKNAKAAQQPEPTQAAQSTQNQTDQAEDRGGFQNEDLHQAFAELAYSYGMLGRNISSESNNEALENIVIDCETLSNVSLAMRLQAKGGVK